jgi:hypothetical protein
MKLDRSQPYTVSMMKQSESTVMQIHGNIVPRSLIILELVLLLKGKFSVFMEVFLQKLKPSIKLDLLTEEWKFLMRVHSVT